MTLTVGELFAGIGGFGLGLERAGMRVAWQVEIAEKPRALLALRFPRAARHDDVRTFPPAGFDAAVDLICGGFPCQDISNAGARKGIDGPRSGLWREFARIVRLLRPHYVVVENTAALLQRGLGRVLGDLAACGFDAEWDCIPACAVGADHERDRIFVVAYARGEAGRRIGARRRERCEAETRPVADAVRDRRWHGPNESVSIAERHGAADVGAPVPDADPDGHGRRRRSRRATPDADRARCPLIFGVETRKELDRLARTRGDGWWNAEPGVVRVVHGFPGRVDRVRALGNAVVPEILAVIGRAITRREAWLKGNLEAVMHGEARFARRAAT